MKNRDESTKNFFLNTLHEQRLQSGRNEKKDDAEYIFLSLTLKSPAAVDGAS